MWDIFIRYNSSQLQLEGKTEGRRSCGRPRNTWTTDMTTTNGTKYVIPAHQTEQRKVEKDGMDS